MAQKRRRKRRSSRRRRRDRTAVVLRLIVVFLILFIAGLILWFIWHDRDLRSGVSALKKERYEEAISCFDDSIKAGKNVSESYRGKGAALFELGKYPEAEEALRTSLDEGGDADGQICNLIALSMIEQKKYEQSIEWLQKGIKDESASDELIQQMRYQLVLAYEKTADWVTAEETAEAYLSDYPEDDQMTREYQFLQNR